MNFVSPALTASMADREPVLTIELAHIWRSKIIDKCAEAERQVLRLIRLAGGHSSERAPFSQKLKTLMEILGKQTESKEVATIRQLFERLHQLSDLRSELAHSTMTVAEVEGETVAVLRNAAAEGTAKNVRTVLTWDEFKECHKGLSNAANTLRQRADRDEKPSPAPCEKDVR